MPKTSRRVSSRHDARSSEDTRRRSRREVGLLLRELFVFFLLAIVMLWITPLRVCKQYRPQYCYVTKLRLV